MPKPVCGIRESGMLRVKKYGKRVSRESVSEILDMNTAWWELQKKKKKRLFPSVTLYSFGLYQRVGAVGNGWMGWGDNL